MNISNSFLVADTPVTGFCAAAIDKDIVNRINETPGNKLEFAMVRRDLKKAYIDRGSVISTAKSWQRMDTDLRTLYIISTNARNVIDKYQSYELMSEIRKVGNEFKLAY